MSFWKWFSDNIFEIRELAVETTDNTQKELWYKYQKKMIWIWNVKEHQTLLVITKDCQHNN